MLVTKELDVVEENKKNQVYVLVFLAPTQLHIIFLKEIILKDIFSKNQLK
jgi:hypothetical protein